MVPNDSSCEYQQNHEHGIHFSSPKDSKDHRHSAAEGDTDRETDGDAAVKRRRLSKKMVRKMLKRLLGGVKYKTALATLLWDLNIPVTTSEEGGLSTSKASKRLRSDDSSPGAEAEKQRSEGTGPMSFSAVVEGIRVGIIHSVYPNQLIDNEHLGTPKGHHGSGRENPGLHTSARVAGSNLRRSRELRLAQGHGGNTRTLRRSGSPDRQRGKRTSPESVLNRLRSTYQGLLTQEWKILRREESGPGHRWTFSMEEASVKARKTLDFKPYFSFGRVQFRLKASKAEGRIH
ncbi:hypothetical protein JTB14_012445 [Gonioctena quinquepunctata]|nr:hypothetical protein JTB14_012445 [Gonioctena quinquepunctata]